MSKKGTYIKITIDSLGREMIGLYKIPSGKFVRWLSKADYGQWTINRKCTKCGRNVRKALIGKPNRLCGGCLRSQTR